MDAVDKPGVFIGNDVNRFEPGAKMWGRPSGFAGDPTMGDLTGDPTMMCFSPGR